LIGLSPGARRALTMQRVVAATLTPFVAPLAHLVMRFGMGWRIEGLAAARAEYRRLRSGERTPLLVCANHLTMMDSELIALALGSPGFFIRHPSSLPWNLPDRSVFAERWWQRALVYVLKCLPIPRGGDRGDVADVLQRLSWVLEQNEVGLVFPEGGRSRSGRVDRDVTTYGVGRILGLVPRCRVLLVHLRGERQHTWSRLPAWGERFHVSVETFEPKSDADGLRRSLDLTRQIVGRLADLEERFFDARQ
jgi:1-acyl-sn-glycerol-3-phosphate acyltransferase